jgi:WD40 repeat protein
MSGRSCLLLTAVCAPLVLGALAADGDKPTDAAPRTDALGDPLPPGVVARLGTERLYQPGVFFMAFSPDDKLLAAVDAGGGLRLWEVSTGREVRRFDTDPFEHPQYTAAPLAFSPDGTLVALGCPDFMVRLWEVGTGRERRRFGKLTAPALQLTFDPRGRRLAVATGGNGVQLGDLEEDKPLLRLGGALETVDCIAFSPDGERVIATDFYPDSDERGSKMICAWNASTGEEVLRRRSDAVGTFRGALSPDGARYVGLLPEKKGLRLIDPTSGRELRSLERQTGTPAAACFSGDGRFVAAACDQTVRVWECADGKALHEVQAPKRSFDRAALSHDGKLLALTGPADDAIHLWDAAAGKALHAFAGHRAGPLTVCFSHDGKSLFTVSCDRRPKAPAREWAEASLHQWDPSTGKERQATSDRTWLGLHAACFSPDGRSLATLTHAGDVRVWETAAGRERGSWKAPCCELPLDPSGWGERVPQPVIDAPALSPDGKTVLGATKGKLLRWEADTGRELAAIPFPAEWDEMRCLLSPDGRTVLAWGWLGKWHIVVMDFPSGHVRWEKTAELEESPQEWAFSADGRTLAAAVFHFKEKRWELVLWEVAGGRERARIDCGSCSAVAPAFSPDGRRLAVGGDGVVTVWEPASGRRLARLEPFRGRADSLAFSPDGKWLAAAGRSNLAVVYDSGAFAGEPAPSAPLTVQELDELWGDLSGDDAASAYRAVARMADSPKDSVPYLKARLKAPAPADERQIARLIAALDDDDFEARERATSALERLGGKTEAALLRVLEDPASEEACRRAARLLAKLDPPDSALPAAGRTELRAVEVLERCGTPEAREVLSGVGGGNVRTGLTKAANAALDRLAKRAAPSP